MTQLRTMLVGVVLGVALSQARVASAQEPTCEEDCQMVHTECKKACNGKVKELRPKDVGFCLQKCEEFKKPCLKECAEGGGKHEH